MTDREVRGGSSAARPDAGGAASQQQPVPAANNHPADTEESHATIPAAGADVATPAERSLVDPSPSMTFPGAIGDSVGRVLDAFIESRAGEMAAISADLAPVLDAARLSVQGGKRLRAAFVYWGWRAAGGAALPEAPDLRPADAGSRRRQGDPPIAVAAAAVELVHASALTHDDVMDDSATRRGGPSAHRLFAALPHEAETSLGAARFGRNSAILLGDLLLTWSDELLNGAGFRPRRLAAARPYFDRLRSEVVAGQYLDVLAQTSRVVSASRAMLVVRYKSAKYTIERPLQFGATLAKGTPKLLTALSAYGVPLGEAFQLRDDVLGVFGDSERTGKPAGDDIREGKRTLLVARAYGNADQTQRRVLDATVGNPDLTAKELESARDVFRATGALRAVETVIAELTTAALTTLATAPVGDDESRAALEALAHRTTVRDG